MVFIKCLSDPWFSAFIWVVYKRASSSGCTVESTICGYCCSIVCLAFTIGEFYCRKFRFLPRAVRFSRDHSFFFFLFLYFRKYSQSCLDFQGQALAECWKSQYSACKILLSFLFLIQNSHTAHCPISPSTKSHFREWALFPAKMVKGISSYGVKC